jgi:hypothetical protein
MNSDWYELGRLGRCVCFGSIELGELAEFAESFVGAQGFIFIDLAEGEADMDEDVLTGLDFGNVFEAGFADDAAELDLTHAQAVLIERIENFAGNSETHTGPSVIAKTANDRTA